MKYCKYFRMLISLVLVSATISMAQEAETLFGPDTDLGFIWGLESRTTKIQDDFSSSYGIYGGPLFNHTMLLAFCIGSNVTHPEVNHSYIGLLGQYTPNPKKLMHFSYQLFVGAGAAKDYEMTKTNAMDNFGNTSGPGFLIIEPGVNIEFNFHKKVRGVLGLSYKLASGLDEDDELIKDTKVTNSDFSGISFNVLVKFGKH